MKMIMVSLVVIGAEHDIEEAAGPIPQSAQECLPARIASRPVTLHGNLLSVREDETRDVDGICSGMLTAPSASPMIDVPAGIGAEMRDPHDALSEMLLRGWKQNMLFEQGPGYR